MQQAGPVRLYGKRGFYDKFEHIVIVILTVLIAVFMSLRCGTSSSKSI